MSAPLPVTVIGVGNMGGAMAQRLCALGWTPWVHDIDASKVQDVPKFREVLEQLAEALVWARDEDREER